jgi:hypothetical protein
VKNKLLRPISIFTFLVLIAPTFLAQEIGDPIGPPIGLIPCGPLFFPKNSPRVGEEHAICLNEAAFRIAQDKHWLVVLDGHRDAKEQRGISITRINFDRRYLIEEKKIDASRIITRNFSDTCPYHVKDAALNRRVEIWFVPKEVDADTALRVKRCANEITPKVVTNEKPSPWNWKKKGWTTWGE